MHVCPARVKKCEDVTELEPPAKKAKQEVSEAEQEVSEAHSSEGPASETAVSKEEGKVGRKRKVEIEVD